MVLVSTLLTLPVYVALVFSLERGRIQLDYDYVFDHMRHIAPTDNAFFIMMNSESEHRNPRKKLTHHTTRNTVLR